MRFEIWRSRLTAAGVAVDASTLEDLASRFSLTPTQIADAALAAGAQVRAQGGTRLSPIHDVKGTVFQAARAQSGYELAKLTRRVRPTFGWDDLVLPEDTLAQLREISTQITQRDVVFGKWGFGARLPLGRSVSVLLSGPSGTGKTMAAEVVANELGVELYQIDLAAVVSKYIGETEKNLDRIFNAAESANAILFFDEADALFGKRSEVRDSHDRYANIEISYLLQKMDQYEGIASFLATNLRGNLDEALIRRLAFTVNFPFPDAASRRRIWERIWPADTPLAEDVDAQRLASEHRLPGGSIRNAALAAAFLAAEQGGPVTMRHIGDAIRREYQKMGKVQTLTAVTGSPTVHAG